jgi:hypothetical protein
MRQQRQRFLSQAKRAAHKLRLKKFQAVRAVEEAAEAHLKLAQDALALIKARSDKLEADEKNAEAAADLAVKKLLPHVPARAPQQVSKASPSK